MFTVLLFSYQGLSCPKLDWREVTLAYDLKSMSDITINNQLNKSERVTAAKLLQSCPTLCDPIDGSPPGSPSLGFSRQEHWSGLPFPSPVHESEK